MREVFLRLRRSLESVATYTMNEFNRILGRLNQFQAMVNSTNLPITTSLDITVNSRMNIRFFVRYDGHIPLINVFRTSDRMIDIPLASISPSIPNYVDRPYQNQLDHIARVFNGFFDNYVMTRDVNVLTKCTLH